ncbi:MAG: nitrite reductase [Marmoricola sp.]
MSRPSPLRTRADRCPGVLRPWPAADGALLRIRLVGGRLHPDQLEGLARLASEYADGSVHLTVRGNVQLRAVPPGRVTRVADGIADLGLLPAPDHERVRNVLVSPLTGRAGGLTDLRPVARRLDGLLCADPELARLPGRFLFVLDDRGDLGDHRADLGALALDDRRARLVAGGRLGPEVDLTEVPGRLVALARRFLGLRGTGTAAAWHVAELSGGAAALGGFDGATVVASTAPPAPGPIPQDDSRHAKHLPVPGGTLTPALVSDVLTEAAGELVVTPWHSVLLTDLEAR